MSAETKLYEEEIARLKTKIARLYAHKRRVVLARKKRYEAVVLPQRERWKALKAQLATLLSERDAARAERDDLLRALEPLFIVGAQMSNLCFNLAQPSRSLRDHDREVMKELQQEWDRARKEVAAAARSRPSSEGGTAK